MALINNLSNIIREQTHSQSLFNYVGDQLSESNIDITQKVKRGELLQKIYKLHNNLGKENTPAKFVKAGASSLNSLVALSNLFSMIRPKDKLFNFLASGITRFSWFINDLNIGFSYNKQGMKHSAIANYLLTLTTILPNNRVYAARTFGYAISMLEVLANRNSGAKPGLKNTMYNLKKLDIPFIGTLISLGAGGLATVIDNKPARVITDIAHNLITLDKLKPSNFLQGKTFYSISGLFNFVGSIADSLDMPRLQRMIDSLASISFSQSINAGEQN